MVRNIARGAAQALPEFLRDILALGAAGAIAYGAWLIYQPAGFIVGGALALAGLYLQAQGAKAQSQGG
jgi:hypothetical protein